jgi:hypothetical protein
MTTAVVAPTQVYIRAEPLTVQPNTFTYTPTELHEDEPRDCEWCPTRDPEQAHPHVSMFMLCTDNRRVFVCHPCMKKIRARY